VKLTRANFVRAAAMLDCEVAAIQAVAEVESLGDGFLLDGRPKILFERHVFSRLTERRFDDAYPDLSNTAPGGYSGGVGEYARLYRAVQLDGDAAVQAASWGAFQIMGFNWQACGEASLTGFLLAVHHDDGAHLGLFCRFIVSRGLAGALRAKDWTEFARGYNGPAFAKNRYDQKIAAAYARHAGVPA
jgi:hypothetical protein